MPYWSRGGIEEASSVRSADCAGPLSRKVAPARALSFTIFGFGSLLLRFDSEIDTGSVSKSADDVLFDMYRIASRRFETFGSTGAFRLPLYVSCLYELSQQRRLGPKAMLVRHWILVFSCPALEHPSVPAILSIRIREIACRRSNPVSLTSGQYMNTVGV